MTGEDHTTEALIAALRSPALPSEHGGESAAVAAMLDAMPTAAPTQPTGRRSRRGLAIAAVTVASLGVGGLVAAGPGGFLLPTADRSPDGGSDAGTVTISGDARPSTGPDARQSTTTTAPPVTPPVVGSPVAGAESPAGDTGTDPCADDNPGENHGEVVSQVARTSEPDAVRDAATSECGKPDGNPASTAPGRTGDSPASTAPGRTGDTPASTAPGRTGDTPASTAPGRTGDTPASAAPGQTGDTPPPEGQAPPQPGDTPASTAPGRTGDTPPREGQAPPQPGADRDAAPTDATSGSGGNGGRP